MPKIVDNEQGVIVVNPNRGNSNGVDNPYTYPLTEDLCIAVNLYVQIPPKTGFAEGVVYEFEWNAGNGGSTVSLFKGRSFGPNDSYLTDYYTDITFDSSSKGESVEGLGIQSIDITYNADYIPQVSIKFVDVRGSSVFASANRSHENGNNDESMEGEFFRAFFTMPYPKFVLKVKGYYGRTASFLLSCVECNHTFDSATGNFIIDASFIGYTFAFFADIPFNILKCISLCEYANCNTLYDFYFKPEEERIKIPTFKDFISSLKTLSTSIEESKTEDSSSKQYRECQEKDTNLNQLNEAGSGLMGSCHTFIKDISGDFENVKTVKDNNVINKISFKIKGENIDKAKQTEILTTIGVHVKSSFESVGNLIKSLGYEKTIPYPTSREIGEIKTIKVSYVMGSKNEYVIDSSSFFTTIKKMMQSNAHEGNVAYNNASLELNQTAYTIMGFSPYIENVMRMIFANLQLFMHAMCTCVNNVSNRKLSDLDGIGDDKELSEAMSPDDLVGAFPSVYDKTGNSMPKECWIGDIVKMKDGTDIEEVKFVKAIFQALKEEYKTEQAVAGDEASINFPHDVWYPLFIYDDPFTNYSENGASNPYKVISQNGSQNGDVVEEAFALIGLRIFKHMFFKTLTFGGYPKENHNVDDKIIEYEAKNIISGIKVPTLDIIQSNPKKVFNSMVKKNIFGKQKTYGVSSVFYNIKDKSDYYMIPFFNVESSKYHIETDKSYDEYPRIIYDGKRPPLGLRIIDNKDIVDGYIKYVQEELQGVENKELIGCEIVEHKNYDELNYPISFFLKSSIYNLNKKFQKDKNIDIQKRLRIKALHFLSWCCNAGIYANSEWDSLEAFPSDHVLKHGITHVMGLAHALYWGGAMWSSRHREEIKDYFPASFYDFKDCGIDNTLVKYFMDWTSMEKVNGVYGDWVRLCNSSEIAYKDSRGIHPLDKQFWSSIFGISDDMTQFKKAVEDWQSDNDGKTIVLSNGADYTSTYKDINMELIGNNKVELQDNTLSEQILRNIFDRSVIVVSGDIDMEHMSFYIGQTPSDYTNRSTVEVGELYEGRRIASKENFYSKLKDISSQSFYDKYAKRLCNKIDELRKQSTEQSISPSSSNGGQSDNDVSDKDIYLSIYKCLQNINQKWSPRQEDKYSLSNFYEKSFSYRDKLFNDIGYKFMLNADKLLGLFVNNRSGGVSEIDFGIGSGYSLMEVLNNIFSYHNMLLVPTPNNIDWLKNNNDNDNVAQSLVDVFTPFQFKDISGDSVPQFIGIYVGMPSTSLNNRVGNGTMSFHKDDGLYLWGSKKTNVSRNEGNALPCFLISFSDQNNSMFKSISVGTKQNAITEQSLAAMYNLFEDSGKMTAKGQDLYSIYSQNSYQATIEMMGDANIQPLMYFQLNNANIFDGCYMIFKMEHHINSNNDMTTRFTGMRMSNVYTPLVEDCVFVNSILGENVFAGSSGEGVSNDGSGGYLSENISNISSSENNSFIGIAKKMLKIFTIEDLVDSNTARQKKIDNTPKTDEIRKNLYALIVNILDPLCVAYQKKFAINSGYRCPELNKEVKGSSNSQHMLGQAADITGGSVSENKKLFNLVKQLNLPFDQMIWEENGRWIHISYGPRNRRDARPKNI